MGNLTRISGSFIIPKSFHGKDQNITGSTEFSASNFSITASEGLHITGSTTVSGGNLTLVGSTFSASQARHPDSATGSVEYVKYVHTGSFASGSDIQIIKAESASYVMSTSTGSYASGSDVQVILAESASYISTFQSESFATLKVIGDISTSGSIYAREFHTEFTSASVVYASGSNKFGDTLDDKHEFTGSIEATGSLLTIDNVGGVSGSLTSTGSFAQLTLPQENNAANPTLNFGDGDTGLYEASDDALKFSIAGTAVWDIDASSLGKNASGYPMFVNEVASATNPTIIPDAQDTNTGIGWSSADKLSLIAGGVSGVEVTTTGISGSSSSTGSFGQIEGHGTDALKIYDGGTQYGQWNGNIIKSLNAGLDLIAATTLRLQTDGGTNVLICSASNVGIGTTAPGYDFELRTNDTSAEPSMVIRQLGTGDASIGFQTAGANNWTIGTDNSISDNFMIAEGLDGADSKFVIDTAGNVGIGETAPANLLHVKVSDTGIAPHASAQIVLEREGTNYLQFLTAETGTSGILFGDGSDVDVSKIFVDHNTAKMTFVQEASEIMTLYDSKVGIGTTSPAFLANAKGLVIAGTGGRLDNPQDGTERIPTLRITDTVTDYGSNTATLQELRGGIEFVSSEGSGTFGGGNKIAGAIYAVNEDPYNRGGGLSFYTNENTTTPTERIRISQTGNVGIGDTNPSTAKLSISGVASGDYGLKIDQDQNVTALHIDSESTSAGVLHLDANATTTGFGLEVVANALAAGKAGSFTTTSTALASTGAGGFVEIISSGDTDTNANNLLLIRNNHADSSGTNMLLIDQNANNRSLYIQSAATTENVIIVDSAACTTGYILNFTEINSLTTGTIARFHSNSGDDSTRNLVEIINDHASAPGATCLFIDQDSNQTSISIDSEATDQDVLSIPHAATTTGNIVAFTGCDSLTDGTILRIESDSDDDSSRSLVEIVNDNAGADGAVGIYIQQDGDAASIRLAGSGGGGIKFDMGTDPDTSGTATGNTLDDYEEGTWTVASAFPGGGSIPITSQVSTYTKIGNKVWINAYFVFGTPSSPSGEFRVGTLPFTVGSTGESYMSLATQNMDLTASTKIFALAINSNTYFRVFEQQDNGIYLDLAPGSALSGDTVRLSGFYTV